MKALAFFLTLLLTGAAPAFAQSSVAPVIGGATAANQTSILNALTSSIPPGSNTIGAVTQANGDPCAALAHSYTPISVGTATSTKIVAGTASKKTYVCHILLFAGGADNVGVVEGSGANCGTSTQGVIGGATAATGLLLPANGGFVEGAGANAVASTALAADDLCLITSAAVQLSGVVVTVQQ